MALGAITVLLHVIQGTEEDDMDETQSIEVTVEDLVEDVSIDGMCGVY